jgi:hypothetical protein
LAAVLLVGVLVAAVLAALALRRFLLGRGGGIVESGLRVPAGPWRPGMVSYHRDELCWYRALGVHNRPERVFARRSLSVLSRRPVTAPEARTLGPGRVVIEMVVEGGAGSGSHLELAMTEAALTGLLSWLEASPPSSHLDDIA